MTRLVGAEPGDLVSLAHLISGDHAALEDLAGRTAWALGTLRRASSGPTVGPVPALDRSLSVAAEAVATLGRDVRAVASALAAADAWRTAGAMVRRGDELVTVRLHELPGLGALPAPTLRELGGLAWGAALEVDRRRGHHLGRLRAVATERVTTVARAVSRHVPRARTASLRGRVADVLSSPALARARPVAGRVVAGLGVAADVVEGVDRAADGDGWGAARSAASAVGGALLVTGNPVAMGVGVVVVAGVLVYEHRDAIVREARHVGRWASRRAQRVARAATGVVDDLGGATAEVGAAALGLAEDLAGGARRLLGGLA